ncbi:MAG: MaoC family dehydratase [Archaeoglobaceae archaeon]
MVHIRLSEEAERLVRKYLKTEKQREYNFDFFVDEERYIRWEDVEIGMEAWSEKEFEVKEEDIRAYLEATENYNPVFWKDLIAPPMFITTVAFWLVGDSFVGSWIKTPGAINPGQKIEFYEPIRVGDVIRVKMRAHDKFIKRGKRYLTYYNEFVNQRGEIVAKWWGTLILPLSRSEEEHRIGGVKK